MVRLVGSPDDDKCRVVFGSELLAAQFVTACNDYAAGCVFMDLWDMEKFTLCADCGPPRIDRLRQMNLLQDALPAISCHCGASP